MESEQPVESKLSQGGFAQIFVRTILSQTITVAIDGTLITDDLLTKIRGKVDLSGHGLVFASRRIEAGRLLTDYNIQNYSIFQQSCRLLGGMEADSTVTRPCHCYQTNCVLSKVIHKFHRVPYLPACRRRQRRQMTNPMTNPRVRIRKRPW